MAPITALLIAGHDIGTMCCCNTYHMWTKLHARSWWCLSVVQRPMTLAAVQLEDLDQATVTALSEWDDGADVSSYDFDNDALNRPIDPKQMRKLAYRYACRTLLSLVG